MPEHAPREQVGEAPRLILASASPRRRELLATLGVAFAVRSARVVEDERVNGDPRGLVRHNAALKADDVAAVEPEAFVLGADTTVFLDGVVLNKPVDRADARRMLRRLAGREHIVYTGLALRCAARQVREDHAAESRVTFRALGEEEIDRYLAVVDPLDKAGGYAIQEHGELIVARWEGSFTNIVGLPIELTREILTRHGLLTA